MLKFYAINLPGPSGEQRRQQVKQEFGSHYININIFPAVVGKEIKISDTSVDHLKVLDYRGSTILYDSSKRINKKIMSKGELGCSMSHIGLYSQLIKDDDNEAYFIFEDDAIFAIPFNLFTEYMNDLPPFDSFDVCTFAIDIMWYKLEFTEKINPHYTHIKKQYFNAAYSYIVTKRGASRLLDYCHYQPNIPADDLLSNSFIWDSVTVIAPCQGLFTIRKDVESSIDQMNENQNVKRS